VELGLVVNQVPQVLLDRLGKSVHWVLPELLVQQVFKVYKEILERLDQLVHKETLELLAQQELLALLDPKEFRENQE
jgi:hypothetical protein